MFSFDIFWERWESNPGQLGSMWDLIKTNRNTFLENLKRHFFRRFWSHFVNIDVFSFFCRERFHEGVEKLPLPPSNSFLMTKEKHFGFFLNFFFHEKVTKKIPVFFATSEKKSGLEILAQVSENLKIGSLSWIICHRIFSLWQDDLAYLEPQSEFIIMLRHQLKKRLPNMLENIHLFNLILFTIFGPIAALR